MGSARETAHDHVWSLCPREAGKHGEICDSLTSLIESERSRTAALEGERDKLRELWVSLDAQMQAAKAYEQRPTGGQTTGSIPRLWSCLRHAPGAWQELSWYARAALTPEPLATTKGTP